MGLSRCIILNFSHFSSRSWFQIWPVPFRKRSYMKQNLLQPFSSITFTQNFWYCCLKEEAQVCSTTHNTFVSQSEKIGSYVVISWVSPKRQKPLPTQRTADLSLSTLAGLLRNWEIDQLIVFTCDSMKAPRRCALIISLLRISYFSGSKHTIKMHSFHKGWLEAKLGLRSTSKRSKKSSCVNQLSQADPSPPCSLSRTCGCFMPSRPASTNPRSVGSGPDPASCIHVSWNSSYSTTHSTRPTNHSCQPIFFFKDCFKLIDKKASIFLR